MIQCPDCRSMIPDGSAFCDQCGKELKWCPECRRPKRGTECPVCGSDLVPGRKYLTSSAAGGSPASPSAAPAGSERKSPPSQASPQGTSATPSSCPLALEGNGWCLPLREGVFGRSGGIWPELSGCRYVSGSHGCISRGPDSGWTIKDNGSTNGTFVNGRRLVPGAVERLVKGSVIRIATLDFTVE